MKLSVAGWTSCVFFQKAANVAAALEHMYGSRKLECEIIEFEDKQSFVKWLPSKKQELNEAENHITSPIVWTTEEGKETFIGGCDETLHFARNFNTNGTSTTHSNATEPKKRLRGSHKSLAKVDVVGDEGTYDYDLIVIGGGSGGLACAKAAAELGAKVVLLDAVKPSPQGTKWGLGGTCVNVGCIPKKLMHQSALLGELHEDAKGFGWKFSNPENQPTHDWEEMVTSITNYIRSLNFGYRVQLRDKKVEYVNKLGKFLDPHTIEVQKVGDPASTSTITGRRILIAVGGRPNELQCPGGDLAITSDDIFWNTEDPGKTLVVGASYIALECAGFLNAMRKDVTVMVRSIFLRGFDQDMANRIGAYMEKTGTKFIRERVPKKLSKTDDGRIKVEWEDGSDVFDTVLAAIGRKPDTKALGLDKAGIKVSPKSGKILTIQEQTNIPHIYAIGDVQEGHLELTPIAIESGKLLGERLYGGKTLQMDYKNVCTTIFTPLEYSCCGLSEEEAKQLAGDAVEVYHTAFTPLEWTVPSNREFNVCYCKVIVDTEDDERVLGFHILSPNAGEIAQGFGIGMKLGMTFSDLNRLVGIHPTVAEELTLLTIKKSSGKDAVKSGC
uniref:Thioredoxin reductase n=1 Tax=Aplanochytrium stocchinoi TaxID=215587 RepID=A0A6S8ENN2_9STRA